MLSAIELSVCSGFVGCGWTNSLGVFLRIVVSFVLTDSTATSASEFDDMTWQMMVAMTCTDPLLIIGFTHFFSERIVPQHCCGSLDQRDRTFHYEYPELCRLLCTVP